MIGVYVVILKYCFFTVSYYSITNNECYKIVIQKELLTLQTALFYITLNNIFILTLNINSYLKSFQ